MNVHSLKRSHAFQRMKVEQFFFKLVSIEVFFLSKMRMVVTEGNWPSVGFIAVKAQLIKIYI